MSKLIPYIFFVLITACSNPNPYNCKIDQAVISKNDSILNDEHEKKSYYAFLKRNREPELETLSNKAYRLIVYYSFERDCWTYRIRQTDDGGVLTLKKTYHKAYKDYCGARDTLIVKKITRKQWQKIDYAFNSNCFWTIPLFDGRHGLDGASYILEAYDPEANYTSAVRWSPEKGTDFKTICNVIQDLDSEVYDD
jgi:hypothetical protein